MKEPHIETKKMLAEVENAPDGEYLASVRNFVRFAQQQPQAFDDILVGALEEQYRAFQSDDDFTGAAEYAIICALWRRPTSKAVPVLCKILVEDPTSGREEIVQILRDTGDNRAVSPLLSVLETLDDDNDEGGHLRSAIAETLGVIGDVSALPALRRLDTIPSGDSKKIARYVTWAIEQLRHSSQKDG